MEDYNRIVIDLYKKCFADYKAGLPVDKDSIMDVQKLINFAIDKAIIHNTPTKELEALKDDVRHLKYSLI